MKSIGIAITIALILLSSVGFAGSLGISVGNVESPGDYDLFFSKMVKGGYAETVVTISSSSEAQVINILVDEELEGWVSFDSGTSFTLEPGTPYKLKAIANPPEDAANGIYEGLISFRASPKPSGDIVGIGSSVVAAVALKTAIEVTGEEIKSARVTGIGVKDTEEGLPIEVSVAIENTGNVRIRPGINVDILNQDQSSLIASAGLLDEEILPTQTQTLRVLVPSEGIPIGQYWADTSVFLDEDLLRDEILTFDILEKGALRITGELVQVWNQPWAGVGDVVKIVATFRNTGEVLTSASFRGEVRLGDKLVKVLESDELDVAAGQPINFTEYFTPSEGGRYVISGHIVYFKKITETKESILNVEGGGAGITGGATGNTDAFNPLLIVVVIILIVAVIAAKKFFGRRRRR